MHKIDALHRQIQKALRAGDHMLALSLAVEYRRAILKMHLEAKG
jgi:hypothetical protein